MQRITVRPEEAGSLHDLSNQLPEGGTVTLTAGDFTFSRPVFVPSNTTIEGQGADRTTITLAPHSNCHLFSNLQSEAGTSNIRLLGMKVYGNRLQQSRPPGHRPLTYSCAIYFRRAVDVVVEAMHFDEICQTAVHFNNSRHLVVKDVVTSNLGWSGLGTSNALDLVCEGLVVRRAGLDTRHSAVHLDGGIGNYVSAVVEDVTGNGIMLDSTYGALKHCEVSATARRCYRGLSISGKSENLLSNVFVRGEFADNVEAGIMVSNAENVVLGDCRVHDNQMHGVLLQGRSGAVNTLLSTHCKSWGNGSDFSQLHGSRENWIFGVRPDDRVWSLINKSPLEKALSNRKS